MSKLSRLVHRVQEKVHDSVSNTFGQDNFVTHVEEIATGQRNPVTQDETRTDTLARIGRHLQGDNQLTFTLSSPGQLGNIGDVTRQQVGDTVHTIEHHPGDIILAIAAVFAGFSAAGAGAGEGASAGAGASGTEGLTTASGVEGYEATYSADALYDASGELISESEYVSAGLTGAEDTAAAQGINSGSWLSDAWGYVRSTAVGAAVISALTGKATTTAVNEIFPSSSSSRSGSQRLQFAGGGDYGGNDTIYGGDSYNVAGAGMSTMTWIIGLSVLGVFAFMWAKR